MSIVDLMFGYYMYIIILGSAVAFIFRPTIYGHKNIRRAIIVLNLPNVLFYIVMVIISRHDKKSSFFIFKKMWNGV